MRRFFFILSSSSIHGSQPVRRLSDRQILSKDNDLASFEFENLTRLSEMNLIAAAASEKKSSQSARSGLRMRRK